MKAWYAFHTKPRCEFLAYRVLTAHYITAYLPLYCPAGKGSAVPLFPRYLFVRCDLAEEDGTIIRHMRGLGEIVAFGGQAAIVPEEGIRLILERERLSGLSPEGDQGISGPLAGLAGSLSPSTSARARVQALTAFLRETNELAAGQERPPEQPVQGMPRLRRWTRGHGRRIRYED